MGILFASNNTIHWSTGISQSTSAGFYDSTKVPYGMYVPDDQSVDGLFDIKTPSTSTIYIEFKIRVPSTLGAFEDGYFFDVLSSSDDVLFRIEISNGAIYGQVYSADGTQKISTSESITSGYLHQFKIALTVDATQVSAQLYVNGVLKSSPTITNSTNRPHVGKINFNLTDAINGNYAIISELLVSEEDRNNFGFTKLTPTSAGTDTNFVGNIANVKDDDINSGMTANVLNDKSSFNMDAYSGGDLIHSYVASATLTVGPSASGSARLYLLIGGVQYPASSEALVPDSKQLLQYEWTVDPSDSNPWTEAKINAAQVGVEVL